MNAPKELLKIFKLGPSHWATVICFSLSEVLYNKQKSIGTQTPKWLSWKFQPPSYKARRSKRFINTQHLQLSQPNLDLKNKYSVPFFQSPQYIPMALVERAFVLFMVMAFVHVSNAAVYKVGDSAGWTTLGNINYKQWAAIKTFEVGDIIRKFFFFFIIHSWILFSCWILCSLWELGLASSFDSWMFIYVLSCLKLSSPQTQIYGVRLKECFFGVKFLSS